MRSSVRTVAELDARQAEAASAVEERVRRMVLGTRALIDATSSQADALDQVTAMLAPSNGGPAFPARAT